MASNVKISAKTQALREVWLVKAANAMRASWRDVGVLVPADVRVTCGFPGGGSPRKRIGECWPRERSAAKINEVFINPVLSDTFKVLDVLGHELLHAVDDCESQHRAVFTRNSKLVGYTGGKHSKVESERAKLLIDIITRQLGPYPHKEVLIERKARNEKHGLHKLECGCGNVAYMTAKKIEEYGFPVCSNCEEQMVPLQERGEKKVVTTI